MSLTVPRDLLDRAQAGEVDDESFVACIRDSLPYAWSVISGLVEERNRTGADFADNQVPGATDRDHGYWRDVGTLDAFYDAHMDLVSVHPVFNLYNKHWPIRGDAENLPPAKFAQGGLAQECIVGSGSILSAATVRNSVLSSNVVVDDGATVEGSVLMPGVRIGRGAVVRRAILDKNVVVGEGEIIGVEKSEFFGVSDTSYNITLAYDRAGLGMRLSYVWRDDFLSRNEARIFANPIGIWRKSEASLDLQLSYNIRENLAVSFDAVNLTEEMQQEYYAFGSAGGPSTMNFGNLLISRSFALGVRWRL